MKIFWNSIEFLKAGFFGYSVHNLKLKSATEQAGAVMVSDPSQADIAVSCTTPHLFKPIPGLKNVLFAQAEMSVPYTWTSEAESADLLVTSCDFSAEVFRKFYHKKIEVCHLGTDPKTFQEYTRKAPAPGQPFYVLFVGDAEGCRKGADILIPAFQAWRQWHGGPSEAVLYLKDSGRPGGALNWNPETRTFHDTRDLSKEALVKLYGGCHVFVTPTLGDAANFPLLEAMSTGLPCIYSNNSSQRDYQSPDCGFPLERMNPVEIWPTDKELPITPGPHVGMEPDPAEIIQRLNEVYRDYEGALVRGRGAAERIREKFTWERAGRRFLEILETV